MEIDLRSETIVEERRIICLLIEERRRATEEGDRDEVSRLDLQIKLEEERIQKEIQALRKHLLRDTAKEGR